MLYKTELHCHTSEVSRCAHENAEDTVKKYVDAGYTTVVLTNHLATGTKFFGDGDYAAGIEYFIEGYHIFEKAAENKLNTILGAEVCLKNRGRNDYLIFGVTEKFLRDNTDILEWNLETLHEKCTENGFLLVHAHPFRPDMSIIKPHNVDGIEVFNGHPGHNSSNEVAEKWADVYGLIKTSGTDHHDASHPATCGIETSTPITTNEELLAHLKSGDYSLLRF